MKSVDITDFIHKALPVNSFPFNPCIAHVTGDTFLLAVRSFTGKMGELIPEERNNSKNAQHPWFTKWKGEEDATYIFPIVLVGESVQPLRQDLYPLKIAGQDTRIFRFCQTGTEIAYILTYNKAYNNRSDLLIKGGDTCDDYCYVIDWSYLVLDVNTLEYAHIPASVPLCLNISNQVEKNWSLWTFKDTHLMLSYSLTPAHTAFSFELQGISTNEIRASSLCKMLTQRPPQQGDFLHRLEEYHDKQLFVSLSTPSYLVAEQGVYQAVGHMKVKIDYLRRAPKGGLKKFKKFARSPLLHPTYVYFMFIYQFKLLENVVFPDEPVENISHAIEVAPSQRINVELTKVSPAFIVETDYLLNFPAGQVILEETGETLISYGNGDRESRILRLSREQVDTMCVNVENLLPERMKFIFLK